VIRSVATMGWLRGVRCRLEETEQRVIVEGPLDHPEGRGRGERQRQRRREGEVERWLTIVNVIIWKPTQHLVKMHYLSQFCLS
jgi:hypothetical protein